MIKLIVICVGVIIIVSTLIDKDPVNILTGLGASAAILMLRREYLPAKFQALKKALIFGVISVRQTVCE